MKRKFWRAILFSICLALIVAAIVLVVATIIHRPESLRLFVVYILIAIVVGAIPALACGRVLVSGIIFPIENLRLEDLQGSTGYEELEPLFNRLRHQQMEIREHLRLTREKQYEFAAITENMREGLVVLDAEAAIISINASALAMFHVTDEDQHMRPISTISENSQLQHTVKEALGGTAAEEIFSYMDREYQVLASPILSESVVTGAILFILDVTERQASEQMRREFSANVSHELKTPLTSISGYAEIMKDGLVQMGDVSRFAERIYGESQRLIALVEDIINISRLDEGDFAPPKEEVDLLNLAAGITKLLWPVADERNVTMDVSGDHAIVLGNTQLLDEMIVNLVDNAIKYNHEGGTVNITVRKVPKGGVTLAVSDTGIGIPREYQHRVFERFYRVDKSHSRATGGTGLGLSIVKHSARYHNAKVELTSTPGEGTTVTLHFPALK